MLHVCRILGLARQSSLRFAPRTLGFGFNGSTHLCNQVRFTSDNNDKCKQQCADNVTRQAKVHKDDPCKPIDKFSTLPKPDCPWEPEYEKANKKHKKVLLFGILFAAATLGVLYWLGLGEVQKEEIKKVVVVVEEKKKERKKLRRPNVIAKDPVSSSEIPDKVPYLLIGGGTASFSAFRAIKSTIPTAKVLVVTKEGEDPYMRPPLSKEVWYNDSTEAAKNLVFKQWNGSERSLYYEPKDFYVAVQDLMQCSNGGVAVAKGWTVTHVDVVEKKAYLEDGKVIEYEKCLIATGAVPKNLDVFVKAPEDLQNRVTLYRNIFDFRELEDITRDATSIAIVGGGFLGSELACSLARKSKMSPNRMEVYQVFPEHGNMAKVLPEYLSHWTMGKIKEEGVTIISKADIDDARLVAGKVNLLCSNKEKLVVDHVIVAVGAEPLTDMAEDSNLEVDPDLGGYVVNAELQARSNLYAAGDCASFYDEKLGRRRIEHHDNAVVSGRLAGENMAGAGKPYIHQAMFWSDLGPDVGFEAIGIVDSSLPTVGVFAKSTEKTGFKEIRDDAATGAAAAPEDGKKPCVPVVKPDSEIITAEKEKELSDDYDKGVIFYLRDDLVVGIVLWNIFNRMGVARQVLSHDKKYDDLNEVAKLFSIHEE